MSPVLIKVPLMQINLTLRDGIADIFRSHHGITVMRPVLEIGVRISRIIKPS